MCEVVVQPPAFFDRPFLFGDRIYKGLIDTGATTSNITQNVVNDLNLETFEKQDVQTANGEARRPVYYFKLGFLKEPDNAVNILVPDKIIRGLGLSYYYHSFDVLIGMDIISDTGLNVYSNKFELNIR